MHVCVYICKLGVQGKYECSAPLLAEKVVADVAHLNLSGNEWPKGCKVLQYVSSVLASCFNESLKCVQHQH